MGKKEIGLLKSVLQRADGLYGFEEAVTSRGPLSRSGGTELQMLLER